LDALTGGGFCVGFLELGAREQRSGAASKPAPLQKKAKAKAKATARG